MIQPTPQITAFDAEPPQPPAPSDLRIRHADNLRKALAKSNLAWATRNRANQALARYEETPGPQAASLESIMFDLLIQIGEICCSATTSASRTLGADWAVNAIERMLQKNPGLGDDWKTG